MASDHLGTVAKRASDGHVEILWSTRAARLYEKTAEVHAVVQLGVARTRSRCRDRPLECSVRLRAARRAAWASPRCRTHTLDRRKDQGVFGVCGAGDQQKLFKWVQDDWGSVNTRTGRTRVRPGVYGDLQRVAERPSETVFCEEVKPLHGPPVVVC